MSAVRRLGFYVDPETQKILRRLVEAEEQRLGVSSQSEVVRRALRELAERELPGEGTKAKK